MSKARYLDRTHDELLNGGNDIVLYCSCGHWKRLEPSDFARLPGWSLYRVISAAKCTVCGKVGDIPQITILPRHTGGIPRSQL